MTPAEIERERVARARRDMFAAAALSGICGESSLATQDWGPRHFADFAVKIADATIALLDAPDLGGDR